MSSRAPSPTGDIPAVHAPTVPSTDEVVGYATGLSNWGRWGPDDDAGTLNLIGEDVRRRALALPRHGRVVSCAWDVDTQDRSDDYDPSPTRTMLATVDAATDSPARERQSGARDLWMIAHHGFRVTHLDALAHIAWDGRLYNGRPADVVTVDEGATALDVRVAASGIVTRGLLVDVPRHRGVDWLEAGEPVMPQEAQAVLDEAGLATGPGDAILLRTGHGARVRRHGHVALDKGHAGWHAAGLPWFHRSGTSLVAADVPVDVVPSGYAAMRSPLHAVGIAAMGLWLIDNCDLEQLADACAQLGTWEFLFVVAPLRLTGGTGSPVNPLAIL